MVILRADDSAAASIRTHYVGSGPVAADVVPTILGVVFDSENAGLRPEAAVAEGFDDLSEGEIVVRDLRLRLRKVWLGATGMIIG